MYVLQPVLHETIWGGSKLNKNFDRDHKKVGHLYLVNGHSEMSTCVLNGEHKGTTLNELFSQKKSSWNMDEYMEFPLTIAMVDAAQNLSIQVHPDELIAEKLEGKKIGKMESWLFLKAPHSGWIYAGCKCKTSEQVKGAVKKGEMEEITDRLELCDNDCVCVEAGTLHAMTSGSFVYEVEFGSDYTYRFYDYGRRDDNGQTRRLDVEKALQTIKPEMKPEVHRNIGDEWIKEKYYEIRKLHDIKQYINAGREIECVTVIDGEGMVDSCRIDNFMSIILLPGEKLKKIDVRQAVTARIRR